MTGCFKRTQSRAHAPTEDFRDFLKGRERGKKEGVSIRFVLRLEFSPDKGGKGRREEGVLE